MILNIIDLIIQQNATINNWTYLVANDTKTVTGSTFNASRPTKIVTSGFMSTGYEDYVQVT